MEKNINNKKCNKNIIFHSAQSRTSHLITFLQKLVLNLSQQDQDQASGQPNFIDHLLIINLIHLFH